MRAYVRHMTPAVRAAIYARMSTESGQRLLASAEAVAALLVFTACVSISDREAWKVDDRERQRFATDRYECMGAMPETVRAGVSTEAHFVACMEARGWERNESAK